MKDDVCDLWCWFCPFSKLMSPGNAGAGRLDQTSEPASPLCSHQQRPVSAAQEGRRVQETALRQLGCKINSYLTLQRALKFESVTVQLWVQGLKNTDFLRFPDLYWDGVVCPKLYWCKYWPVQVVTLELPTPLYFSKNRTYFPLILPPAPLPA